MNRTIAARIAAVALAVAALVGVQVAQAPPARAITTYGCNPSASTWSVKARWDDGSVMESRACLQADGQWRRARTEWRVRRGTTALSGTDWDMDSNFAGDTRYRTAVVVPMPTDIWLGEVANYSDIFNTSYVVTHSTWSCLNTTQTGLVYYGTGQGIRATPPGLPRSGYKTQSTDIVDSPTISC
jgi:hypothetical protein